MRLRHQIKVGYLDLMRRANPRTMRDANSAGVMRTSHPAILEFPDKNRSCLTDVVQLDLFSTPARQRQLEVPIDKLAERFDGKRLANVDRAHQQHTQARAKYQS